MQGIRADRYIFRNGIRHAVSSIRHRTMVLNHSQWSAYRELITLITRFLLVFLYGVETFKVVEAFGG